MKRLFLLALASAFLTVKPAAADPLSTEARSQLQKDIKRLEEKRREFPREEPVPGPKIITSEEETRPAAAGEEDTAFELDEILIEGNTVMGDKLFEPAIQPCLHRAVTLKDLKSLSSEMTRIYRAQGFVTSRVYLPPQKVIDNRLTLRALEGKIGKVAVQGNRYFLARFYEDMLDVRPGSVLSYPALEESLYRLNRLPDRQVQAFIAPEDDPEYSSLTLEVKETYPVHAYYGFNNHGTKLTHRARHHVELLHNNISGNADALGGWMGLAEEGGFGGGTLRYERPAAWPLARFSKLHIESTLAESQLLKHLKPSAVESEYFGLSVGWTADWVQKPERSFSTTIGFDAKDYKTLVSGQTDSFDRMRILKLAPRLALHGAGGSTLFSGDIAWGIPDLFGGSDKNENVSRPDSGGRFFYVTPKVQRTLRLPYDAYFSATAGGQWTWNHLTSLELFRAGGAHSVRGYPESDAVGDAGYDVSLELNIPPPWVSPDAKIPFTNYAFARSLRFISFLDAAGTHFLERARPDETKNEFLLGVGVGLRVMLERCLYFELDYGVPLGDKSSDNDRPQFHLALRAGF